MDSVSRKARVEARIRRERRAVLVVNCRSRRGARLYPHAERLLEARGFEITKTFILQQGDVFDEMLEEALAEHPALLVRGSGATPTRLVLFRRPIEHRAESRGQSLQQYLAAELRRLAERPSLEEIFLTFYGESENGGEE